MLFAVFCPLFLTYPVAEVEVLGRKEIFILISYILIINIFSYKFQNFIKLLLFTFIILICILIWEGVLFYILYFYLILILNQKKYDLFFLLFLITNFILISITLYFIIDSKLTLQELRVCVTQLTILMVAIVL